jgi:hypothetical protein
MRAPITIANTHLHPPVITEPSVLVASTGTRVVEQGSGTGLQLMPNPAHSELIVRINDGPESGELRILALDGRVVRTTRMDGRMVVLNVGHLATGTYLLDWRAPGGVWVVERFVKDQKGDHAHRTTALHAIAVAERISMNTCHP